MVFVIGITVIERALNYSLSVVYNKLTSEEEKIIEGKGTEAPFSGEYDKFFQSGVYLCRRCNNPVFSSKAKFDAGTGWPSFDDSFPDAIRRFPDLDGERIEIRCINCGAHLGHVFTGEHLTDKDTRYCANSLSLRFIPKGKRIPKTLRE